MDMPLANRKIKAALQLHELGNLQQAEEIYREVLAVLPEHQDALHLLGLVAYQTGHYDEALELIFQALDVDNAQPDFYNNLGRVLEAKGLSVRAELSYQTALELDASHAQAQANLAKLKAATA